MQQPTFCYCYICVNPLFLTKGSLSPVGQAHKLTGSICLAFFCYPRCKQIFGCWFPSRINCKVRPWLMLHFLPGMCWHTTNNLEHLRCGTRLIRGKYNSHLNLIMFFIMVCWSSVGHIYFFEFTFVLSECCHVFQSAHVWIGNSTPVWLMYLKEYISMHIMHGCCNLQFHVLCIVCFR